MAVSRSAPQRRRETGARLDRRALVVRRAARVAAALSRRLRGGSGLVIGGPTSGTFAYVVPPETYGQVMMGSRVIDQLVTGAR